MVTINDKMLGWTSIDFLMRFISDCAGYFEEGTNINICANTNGDTFFGLVELGWDSFFIYTVKDGNIVLDPIGTGINTIKKLLLEIKTDIGDSLSEWVQAYNDAYDNDFYAAHDVLAEILTNIDKWQDVTW